jgi:hypothetical protein
MKIKNPILMIIFFLSGAIPLIGGLIIFFTWLLARYLFVYDFNDLEFIGIFWTMGSFFLAIAGLMLLLFYFAIYEYNKYVLWTLMVILINIPALYCVGVWQADVEKKVFVKLYNQSSIDNLSLTLIGKNINFNLGTIDKNDSKVFSYNPPYSTGDGRHYQIEDTLRMIITNKQNVDTITFPKIKMGECKYLQLNNKLKITAYNTRL